MDIRNEGMISNALIDNLLETRFDNLNQSALDSAKNRIIDVIGCLIGGVNAPGNAQILKLVQDWGGKPEATTLIHGFKAPAMHAAMLNSIMARSFDFEPVSPTVENISLPGHISGSTVTTAIATGEINSASGKELITALCVGDDLASRVLAGSGFKFSQGWDNIGTITAFGTTAVAGRLLHLDKLQMRNALGLVLNQLAGNLSHIWDRSISFKLTQGLASRNGIFSAQLAQAGWTAQKDPLFGKFGYYTLYTEGCSNPDIVTRNLGQKFYGDATFKAYSCCRVNHAAIDCALAIVHKQDIQASDIREIILYIATEGFDNVCAQPFKIGIGDFPQVNAAWSYQYTVATALLRRSVKPEHFLEGAIRDPEIVEIIKKMKFVELPGADLNAAKLTIILKDSREFTEYTDAPKGDPFRSPLSKDEIIAKYWANVEFSRTITVGNAQKILSLLESLEELESVNRLVDLLIA